jgi:hypothetical protein
MAARLTALATAAVAPCGRLGYGGGVNGERQVLPRFFLGPIALALLLPR